MTETTVFHPFQDRLSRDIRNDLSSALVKCLQCGDISPALKTAQLYLAGNPADCYVSYIEDRLRRYQKAIKNITHDSNDPIRQGLVLWDLNLFFEFHEVLEHAWYHAEGNQKLLLQALIRAAGVYIKLEYGYTSQAARIAAKSIAVLKNNKELLQGYFQPEILIDALGSGSPMPPKLLDHSLSP